MILQDGLYHWSKRRYIGWNIQRKMTVFQFSSQIFTFQHFLLQFFREKGRNEYLWCLKITNNENQDRQIFCFEFTTTMHISCSFVSTYQIQNYNLERPQNQISTCIQMRLYICVLPELVLLYQLILVLLLCSYKFLFRFKKISHFNTIARSNEANVLRIQKC